MMKSGFNIEIGEFWTVRMLAGGMQTDILEFFFTKEQAEKCSENNYRGYNTFVQKEKMKVKLNVIEVL
jgi:hypothetical protein